MGFHHKCQKYLTASSSSEHAWKSIIGKSFHVQAFIANVRNFLLNQCSENANVVNVLLVINVRNTLLHQGHWDMYQRVEFGTVFQHERQKDFIQPVFGKCQRLCSSTTGSHTAVRRRTPLYIHSHLARTFYYSSGQLAISLVWCVSRPSIWAHRQIVLPSKLGNPLTECWLWVVKFFQANGTVVNGIHWPETSDWGWGEGGGRRERTKPSWLEAADRFPAMSVQKDLKVVAELSLLISTLLVHSPAFFPKPLPIISCVGCG